MTTNGVSRTSLRTVGLFAGIGGFEVGLSKAGHKLLSMCEVDAAGRAVLQKRFDGIEVHADIQKMSALPRGTDLVVGGFPCQDLSQVGTTQGFRGAKSGV